MLLLDTHAFVWLASAPEELSPRARRAIRENAGHLYISAISALEIAILVKRNRLSLPLLPDEFIRRALKQHNLHEIPVDRSIAITSTMLPDLHSDLFDRIIIATARLERMSILTKDRVIPRYPDVKVIW